MGNELFRFTVGHFNCLAIRDGDEDDFDRNVLLIHTGQHYILVETGNGHDFEPNRGLLLDRLQAAGLSGTVINVVIISPAEWDHIRGASENIRTVAFPSARYVLARAEWDFWLSKPERVAGDAFDEAFRELARTLPQTRLAHV